MVTFSVIVPTIGRDTLQLTVYSIVSQLEEGDELLVLCATTPWGNASRQSGMERAVGSHLLFIDDDDAYCPEALQYMRGQVGLEPERVHIFKMKYWNNGTLWSAPALFPGNVGTPMFVVPNEPGRLGPWAGEGYTSDYEFIAKTLELRGQEPIFHDKVVAMIRPEGAFDDLPAA